MIAERGGEYNPSVGIAISDYLQDVVEGTLVHDPFSGCRWYLDCRKDQESGDVSVFQMLQAARLP